MNGHGAHGRVGETGKAKAGLCSSVRTRKARTPGGNLRVETSRAFDTGPRQAHDGTRQWIAHDYLSLVSPAWLVGSLRRPCGPTPQGSFGREYDATIGGDGPRHSHCSETQPIRRFDAGRSKSKSSRRGLHEGAGRSSHLPCPSACPCRQPVSREKRRLPPPERDADWPGGPRWATAGRDRTT